MLDKNLPENPFPRTICSLVPSQTEAQSSKLNEIHKRLLLTVLFLSQALMSQSVMSSSTQAEFPLEFLYCYRKKLKRRLYQKDVLVAFYPRTKLELVATREIFVSLEASPSSSELKFPSKPWSILFCPQGRYLCASPMHRSTVLAPQPRGGTPG